MDSKRIPSEDNAEDGKGGSKLFHLLMGTSRWPRAWVQLSEKMTPSERAALARAIAGYHIAFALCSSAIFISAIFVLFLFTLRMAAWVPIFLIVAVLEYVDAVRVRPRRLAHLLSQTHWATEHGVTADALLAARTRKGSSGIDLESL